MRKILPKTIRSKITIITVLVTLTIATFVASICFYIFQSFLRKSLVQSTEFNLQLIMDTINTDLDELIYLTKWSSTNTLFIKYLESNTSDSDGLSLEAYDRLKEEYQNSRSSDYIKRLIISDDDSKFLQVGNLNNLGLPYDALTAKKQVFFTDLLKTDEFNWIGIENDIFISTGNEQIIPIARPIYGSYGNEVVGWVFLAISSNIITDHFINYTIPEDSDIYFTIGEKTYLFGPDYQLREIDFKPKTVTVLSGNTMNPSTIVQIVQVEDGNQRTLVSCFSSIENWYISQSLSESQFASQKLVYYFLLILIVFLVVSLGIGLTIYINHTINVPIRGIRKKLVAISKGDFSKDQTIEWEHELGEIGKGINVLSRDVVTLMNKRIEDEKQQKDLEYKILQSQINPHFLHNTLNSIKWMATIQNATGISEMTTALSRLLKSISNRTDQIITIKEEMPSDLFQHIGINNVHRRIQHAFGEGYGISIESEPPMYTETSIRIPYIKGRE